MIDIKQLFSGGIELDYRQLAGKRKRKKRKK